MSEESLGEKFMEMIANGVERIGPEIGAEVQRLGIQSQMEMASALFGGNAFVPYGPGQYTPSNENQPAIEQAPSVEVQQPQIEAAQQEQHQGRSM